MSLGFCEIVALRLGAALVAGGVLGLNRELHGKPAGFRTHALVALGAAAATMASLATGDSAFHFDGNASSRVVQGLLTGVGFIGAGVILRDPAGHITGLTTAATIWVCAILGILCGLGYWIVLGIGVIFTALTLSIGGTLERIADRVFKKRNVPPDHSV